MLNGGDSHLPLASFYDVPQVRPRESPSGSNLADPSSSQISLRGPLLPALVRDHSLARPFFQGELEQRAELFAPVDPTSSVAGDPRHIAAPLHAFLGRMVVALLQESRCSGKKFMPTALVDEDDEAPESPSESIWPGVASLGEVPRVSLSRSGLR
jgi:hypothetical protein